MDKRTTIDLLLGVALLILALLTAWVTRMPVDDTGVIPSTVFARPLQNTVENSLASGRLAQ